MRPALARLQASAMISSSIRLSLAGAQVGWIKKMSRPRTFSPISTWVSPSEKRLSLTRPRGTCM